MVFKISTPRQAEERDLSKSVVDDENTQQNGSSSKSTVKRSFSWGKKKKWSEKKKVAAAAPMELSEEARVVTIDRQQADNELGFELHEVTGDVIVSHVGATIADLEVGDCVLSVQSVPLDGGDYETLEGARYILREPDETVELIIQRHTVRREVLKRHAALIGTSLDKLGLTLEEAKGHIVINAIDGLAAKSRRISVGDRVIAINGERVADLQSALDLLAASANSLEVELDIIYGYIAPPDHEFEPETGLFVPVQPKEPVSGFTKVKRSLSFGKKKKKAEPSTPRAPAPEEIPELDFEPRLLTIQKNEARMILVTFKAHAITGELIIGLVGDGSPAELAGVEVGDAVLAVQGQVIDCGGDDGLEQARTALAESQEADTVELLVQTRTRIEVLEFAAKELGGPRTYLGISYHSFENDKAVRITQLEGPAAKAGCLTVGDRIVAVNGVRVNHAGTLSDLIAQTANAYDYVQFEVALGWAAGEGLWYGKESEAKAADPSATPRKAKRSFSFGRKPRF